MTTTSNKLTDAEKLARLRLARTAGIGPVTFRELLARFGSGEAALAGVAEMAARGGRKKPMRLAGADTCTSDLEKLHALGGTALFWGTAPYPALLAETEDAPPVLYIVGDAAHLNRTAIGIVGARNASAAGLKLTKQIAADLAEKGVTVVSGLARGVDTAAHMAAVRMSTVACVAGGLDVVYPPENRGLYEDIVAHGAVVSERPMGAEPQARHFPRRNRLISGLSKGVLVVEAAQKSGSLITARFAADQGRDVFAVPGSPLDPRAEGTNRLIRDGATLTRNADDILAELETLPLMRAPVTRATVPQNHGPVRPIKDGPKAADALLDLLTASPIHIDDVVRLSGLTSEAVATAFLEYELAGKITRHAGGRVSRLL
ncbi:DNA-processing protein DprA [Kordiimonas marina]|uniref:DNA-processing protein DprA n=1 Tax=Kordiimonas marina TaxID=2872312 RepID=UPI001FF25906|nr:DNA-processing protein DprA [Kordiimonas marina]MCJ9429223.1 DNA-processing protein DprA [Kordiimonas marina]